MIVLLKKTLLLLAIMHLCCVFVTVKAQSKTNGIYVSRGLAVSFFFDSSQKLANGITYSDFGEILVTNTTLAIDSVNWQISVYADAPFDNGMPFDVVEITADAGANGISTGATPLSAIPLPLINSDKKGTKMPVAISYSVGTKPLFRVNGYPAGYYRTNLHFVITFSP